MFVFREIRRALLSCYLCFEIHPFPLLPTNDGNCYLERENYKVLRFHVSNLSCIGIRASSFKCRPPISAHDKVSKLNKCHGCLLEEMRCLGQR